MVKGGLLTLRAMDSPRRTICCTVYGPRFCCGQFGGNIILGENTYDRPEGVMPRN